MRASLLVSSVAFALACQSPPTRAGEQQAEQTAERPTPATAEPACKPELLRTELTGFCEFDLGVPPIRLPKVDWTAATYHPLATRVITLDDRGLTDPEGTGTVSIQQWLDEPPRRLPEPGEMVLAIAAELPAQTVAELLRGLADAGRKQVRVLVHVADPRPIPRARDLAMLAGMREALPNDPNERVVFVAKAVQGYAETCPPVAGVFPQLTQVAPGDRCAKLGELAAKAIVECGCAELDRIMTLLYALTVGFEVPPGRAAAVLVELDPSAAVPLTAGATWGEIAAAHLKNVELQRFWIEG